MIQTVRIEFLVERYWGQILTFQRYEFLCYLYVVMLNAEKAIPTHDSSRSDL